MDGHWPDMRPRLTWVALLVAVLVCMPTLVRATQSLTRDSSVIRLNRGFDAPESKCRVVPPAVPVSVAVVVVLTAPRTVLTAQPITVSAPLLNTQHRVSPAVLRGPPLSSTNA